MSPEKIFIYAQDFFIQCFLKVQKTVLRGVALFKFKHVRVTKKKKKVTHFEEKHSNVI